MPENRCLASFLIVAIALCLLCSVVEAREPFNVRAYALWVQPDLDFKRSEVGGEISADADGALGFGASAEYQFSDRLGVDLGLFRAAPDINLSNYIREFDITARATDGLAMTPLSLGLDIHLLPRDRVDLYLAPFVSWVYYGDLEFFVDESIDIDGQIIRIRDSVRVEAEDDLAYGATLGIDVPFSSRPWAVSAGLRYMWTELDLTDPDGVTEKLDFATWIVSLGLRYTF